MSPNEPAVRAARVGRVIAAGEQLTERQALQALLLPSANNIAAVLARWDAGSEDQFVARMNAAAQSLGMTHTRYTDPSGYDDATISTAADQLLLVDRAMCLPTFASIVATPSTTLPVAGTCGTPTVCLGTAGLWRQDRQHGRGRRLLRLSGHPPDPRQAHDDHRGRVGQPGHDLVAASLAAADAMVDRIARSARARAMPVLQP